MAFLMEKMVESDHAKIFSPANIQLMEEYCAVNEEWEPIGENRWAIDRQRDAIFMYIPTTSSSDVCLYYALVLKSSLIVIQKDSRNHIKPLDIPAHVQVQKDEIEQMIREAFMVHGYYGIGSPKDAVDIPDPIFE